MTRSRPRPGRRGLRLGNRGGTPPPAPGRIGIIDIGSNSIRLVVYDAPARTPVILFNEKVMAGLGKGLAKDGALAAEGIARGLAALKAALARQTSTPGGSS